MSCDLGLWVTDELRIHGRSPPPPAYISRTRPALGGPWNACGFAEVDFPLYRKQGPQQRDAHLIGFHSAACARIEWSSCRRISVICQLCYLRRLLSRVRTDPNRMMLIDGICTWRAISPDDDAVFNLFCGNIAFAFRSRNPANF